MLVLLNIYDLFFFQAEDGIRDTSVTGVQTCALPISDRRCARALVEHSPRGVAHADILSDPDARIPGFGGVTPFDLPFNASVDRKSVVEGKSIAYCWSPMRTTTKAHKTARVRRTAP